MVTMDLMNAEIRISERDTKIERQAEIITRLETSRNALKKENKELRAKNDELKDRLKAAFMKPQWRRAQK